MTVEPPQDKLAIHTFIREVEGMVNLTRSSTHPDPAVREQLGYVAALLEGSLVKLKPAAREPGASERT